MSNLNLECNNSLFSIFHSYYIQNISYITLFILGYYLYKKYINKKTNTISTTTQIIFSKAEDIYTFNKLIETNKSKDINPKEVIMIMYQKSITPNTETYNNLLLNLYSTKKYEEASNIVNNILTNEIEIKPDISTYNIILKGISDHIEYDDTTNQKLFLMAVQLLDSMKNNNIKLNDDIYSTIFDICIKTNDFNKGLKIYGNIKRKYESDHCHNFNKKLYNKNNYYNSLLYYINKRLKKNKYCNIRKKHIRKYSLKKNIKKCNNKVSYKDLALLKEKYIIDDYKENQVNHSSINLKKQVEVPKVLNTILYAKKSNKIIIGQEEGVLTIYNPQSLNIEKEVKCNNNAIYLSEMKNGNIIIEENESIEILNMNTFQICTKINDYLMEFVGSPQIEELFNGYIVYPINNGNLQFLTPYLEPKYHYTKKDLFKYMQITFRELYNKKLAVLQYKEEPILKLYDILSNKYEDKVIYIPDEYNNEDKSYKGINFKTNYDGKNNLIICKKNIFIIDINDFLITYCLRTTQMYPTHRIFNSISIVNKSIIYTSFLDLNNNISKLIILEKKDNRYVYSLRDIYIIGTQNNDSILINIISDINNKIFLLTKDSVYFSNNGKIINRGKLSLI